MKNDMVTIRLFKDNGKYKDDLTVCLNGRVYKIQRGIQVEVPRSVYEIIVASEEQDYQTSILIEKNQKEYEAESRKYE